jgi:hypothetical protein
MNAFEPAKKKTYPRPSSRAYLTARGRLARDFVQHMTDTPNLALPYILASQAQKHVTHNEAIRALDCLVQLSVTSRVLASPPASPVEGSRYIVAADASGDWLGQSNKIAAYQDGAWAFYAPKDGWLAWVASSSSTKRRNGRRCPPVVVAEKAAALPITAC